jgi:hypothetical protein
MAYDPTNGEVPLTEAPKWGGAGGGDQAAKVYAWDAFVKQFGRNPTQSELTMLSSAYISGDPNIANVSGGNSAVAQYFQSQANTPANQYAAEQKRYAADAPKFYDQINGMFQQSLGRDATDAEKSHFGSLLASGQVDPYTVNQFVTTLPEAVKKQDESFRSNLSGTLQGQDAQYYREQIAPALAQQAVKAGRSVDSSGIQNSLALAAQQQNRQRESFLSNLSAQQYGGQQSLAQGAYQQAYGSYQGLQDYSRQRSDYLRDATNSRIQSLQDYAMQKQAYDQYLQRYGKRSGAAGYGALAGGLVGAGVGAYFGGPAGMQAGYQAGSGLGGGIGSFWS